MVDYKNIYLFIYLKEEILVGDKNYLLCVLYEIIYMYVVVRICFVYVLSCNWFGYF